MQDRLQFAQIGSYEPAIDYRKSGLIGIVAGENFAWTAYGVRSAYASRLIAADNAMSLVYGAIAYQVSYGSGYHVAVGNSILKFNPMSTGSVVGTWEEIAELPNLHVLNPANVPDYRRGFTQGFLNNKAYLCGWNHGVHRIDVETDSYYRLTSVNTPGFPEDTSPILAIADSNGRMLYLTEEYFYWSAPNDPENLIPTLGGAGFQLIGERASGVPKTLIPVATGAIIWTDRDVLVAEFVGGETVFRFYELTTDIRPLGQAAVTNLATGITVILTRLGLYTVQKAESPQPITPLFNEFIRAYMETRRNETAHLWYTPTSNQLFVSLKTSEGSFSTTFVLDIGLDKWGMFNRSHYGMFHYNGEYSPFAYMNTSGVSSYFLPRNDTRQNRESSASPGLMLPLDSYVELGYVRSENLVNAADAVQQIQEVTIYRRYAADTGDDLTIDEGVAGTDEITLEFDEGIVGDTITDYVDEGNITMTGMSVNYAVSLLSDLFGTDSETGEDYTSRDMYLASTGRYADTWTGLHDSFYFRIRVAADTDDSFFELNAVDCTIASAGQII